MTTFDERERSFENLFAHDAEQHFKAAARRNWLLGIWAAEKMGFDADKAKKYAGDLLISHATTAQYHRPSKA